MKFFSMRSSRNRTIARNARRFCSQPKRRNLSLEGLESRRVFDAGWAQAIQGALVWDADIDSAGNTYLTGAFVSQAQFGDRVVVTETNGSARFVAKSDAAGEFLWVVKFDEVASGAGSGHESRAISVDADGNAFVAGIFAGTAQFGSQVLTSHGGTDAFLAKIDGTNGSFLWSQSYGAALDDVANDVVLDRAGNAVLSAGFDGTRVASVLKIATNGTELWTTSVTGPNMVGGFKNLSEKPLCDFTCI